MYRLCTYDFDKIIMSFNNYIRMCISMYKKIVFSIFLLSIIYMKYIIGKNMYIELYSKR